MLLGAAFVAVGYRIGPERFWLLAFTQYLPYPIHLAPALAAVAVSLALGRAWRLAALLALVLVVWVVMGLELHPSEAADGRMRVRVMTYNIKSHLAAAHPDGFARLAREIDAQAPDILLLEDAGEPSALRRLNLAPVAALVGDRQQYAHGQFVIASRYPLRDCAPGAVSAEHLGETSIHCIADIDGTEVDLVAAHLHTPRHGLNATRREALSGGVDDWQQNIAARMAQAADLAGEIRTGTRPVILGGDLNAPEASLVVRTLLEAGLRDAFSTAGFGYGYTYGHALRPGFSFLRIDHLLVSPQIGVADCHAGGSQGSEHRPVIADLLLDRGTAQGVRREASSQH